MSCVILLHRVVTIPYQFTHHIEFIFTQCIMFNCSQNRISFHMFLGHQRPSTERENTQSYYLVPFKTLNDVFMTIGPQNNENPNPI